MKSQKQIKKEELDRVLKAYRDLFRKGNLSPNESHVKVYLSGRPTFRTKPHNIKEAKSILKNTGDGKNE